MPSKLESLLSASRPFYSDIAPTGPSAVTGETGRIGKTVGTIHRNGGNQAEYALPARIVFRAIPTNGNVRYPTGDTGFDEGPRAAMLSETIQTILKTASYPESPYSAIPSIYYYITLFKDEY